MWNLSLSSSFTPRRPRIGSVPSFRRLIRLVLLVLSCFLVVAVFVTLTQSLPSGKKLSSLRVESADKSNQQSETQSEQSPEEQVTPARKKTDFRVHLVSAEQIAIARLQQKITRRASAQQQLSTNAEDYLEGLDYANTVERIIARKGNQRYQRLFGSIGLRGEAEVQIAIAPNGSIRTMSILTSSGSSHVDREILASIHESAPFPPLPQKLAQLGIPFSLTRWIRFDVAKGLP